jgi:hypothetical protein
LPEGVIVRVHVLEAVTGSGLTVDGLVDAAIERKSARMHELLESAELAAIALSEDPVRDAEGDEEDLGTLLRYLLGESE